MSELTREVLDRSDLWKRGLFMLLFSVLYSVAEVVISLLALVQFVLVLTTGSANQQLLRLGSSLARFSYQVVAFLSFNTDERPFPLADWPDDDAENSPWFEGGHTRVMRREEATGAAESDDSGH